MCDFSSEFSIRSWMNGKTLFITGATGFLGKVLVEKLLHDCCGIQRIYLLFRAHDTDNLYTRFTQYKTNQIFGRLEPEDLEKLHPIQGDLTELQLGLSDSDRDVLVSEVNVIMHSAASVKFNEEIKSAVALNIRGTRELAELAKQMMQLLSFVHVSTAFSNCHLAEIEEKIYEAHFDPRKVIKIYETDENSVESVELASKIAKLYPNMYIFTKNLTEKLISEYGDELPIAIVRPSIITPSLKDPYPGWLDSTNGPMGLMMGAATGLIRSACGFKWAIADFIPVDKAANGIIAVAVEMGRNESKTCPIYNMVTSNEAPITWHNFLEIEKQLVIRNPFPSMLWCPGGGIHENKLSFYISFILFQMLPSVGGDLILLVLRKRPWLIRFQLRVYRNLELLTYFISHSWKWRTPNVNALFQRLNHDERTIFGFKLYNMNYTKYCRDWHVGSKKFYLKVEPNASQATIMKLRMFLVLEFLIKAICFLVVGFVLMKIFGQHRIFSFAEVDTCSACSKSYLDLKDT